MDSKSLAREWIELAEMDLASARHLQTMRPVPLEIICYHCQQSSEKYLKGYLVLNSHEVVKTHDLMLLNDMCSDYNADFKSIEQQCLRLTDYSVNVRYPYPFELNKKDVAVAVADAEAVREFVLEKIGG